MNTKSEYPEYEDDAGKRIKRRSQQSRSDKRADHKHQYVKTITMSVSPYTNGISGYFWGTHCEICGRRGNVTLDNRDDFYRPEYRGKHIWASDKDVLLPFHEIRAKYPDVPVYRTSDNFGKDIRIR